MTIEKIISQIRKELIRSISGLDAWFDKEDALFSRTLQGSSKTVRELIEDVVMVNRHLLSIIDKARTDVKVDLISPPMDDYHLLEREMNLALNENRFSWPNENSSFKHTSLEQVRYEIREQLDRCLIHLELLMEGQASVFLTELSLGSIGRLDVYQSIYFLAVHVRRILSQLDGIVEDREGRVQRS
jgi:hypothetical protein